jgi:hypothetical protein
VGRGTTYYGCNESNTMLYVALLEIEVEDLDYRMSLMQKMGRLGSSLPRLGILSILPCLSGLRRALAGHPQSISSFVCRPYHYPSGHAVLGLECVRNRHRNCASVYGVRWGLFSESKAHSFPGFLTGSRSNSWSCIDLPPCQRPACRLLFVSLPHCRS